MTYRAKKSNALIAFVLFLSTTVSYSMQLPTRQRVQQAMQNNRTLLVRAGLAGALATAVAVGAKLGWDAVTTSSHETKTATPLRDRLQNDPKFLALMKSWPPEKQSQMNKAIDRFDVACAQQDFKSTRKARKEMSRIERS